MLGGVIALVAIVLSTWWGRPSAEPVPSPPPSPIADPPASSEQQRLVVSVVGEVARPGLVTVRAGTRVADALREAGGPLPGTDVTSLNLARKVSDGEQLYVGIPPPSSVAEAGGRQAGGVADAKVDLNSATEEQLDELPGVGEVTAERIVQWREENGGFDSVDQLREVDGIGDTRFSRLREQVRV